MKSVFLLLIITGVAFANTYEWSDEIFPPDPIRSIEDLKMKPMVAPEKSYFGSGTNNQTSIYVLDRTKKSVNPGTSSGAEWKSKISAAEKSAGVSH